MRMASLVFVTAFFAASAWAQKPAPQAASPGPAPALGDYSGTLQQEGGGGTSDVKMNIKHVTQDGRVTARVQAAHPLKPCTANLPANGLVLKDGGMRLEVNDGAPEGCERIYQIKSASGGRLSGTYIDAVRTGGKLLPRTKK